MDLNMDGLPDDILLHINTFLSLSDTAKLVFVNKKLQTTFNDLVSRECMMKIDNCWNKLAPTAEYLTKSKDIKYRTHYNWQSKLEEYFSCSANDKCCHYVKIIYTQNPRDVDILSYYLNQQYLYINI
jgi:hypothetical protein